MEGWGDLRSLEEVCHCPKEDLRSLEQPPEHLEQQVRVRVAVQYLPLVSFRALEMYLLVNTVGGRQTEKRLSDIYWHGILLISI